MGILMLALLYNINKDVLLFLRPVITVANSFDVGWSSEMIP